MQLTEAHVADAWPRLAPEDQWFIVQCLVLERTQSDVCAELGLNQMAVSRRVSRALQRLRRLMGVTECDQAP